MPSAVDRKSPVTFTIVSDSGNATAIAVNVSLVAHARWCYPDRLALVALDGQLADGPLVLQP